jgi:hypothetical protein
MTDKDLAALIWERYEGGIEYQNSIGLRRLIPEYIRFYEGKQWPEATRNTKNLPRPVINIVKMICRNKNNGFGLVTKIIFGSRCRILHRIGSMSYYNSVTISIQRFFNRFNKFI